MINIKDFIIYGNTKVPHISFNITTAVDCPSAALGLCQLKNTKHCYALRFEKFRKNVMAKHILQAKVWEESSVDELVDVILRSLQSNKKDLDKSYIRFNVAGDFRDMADVEKLCAIADKIPDTVFYGYSARKDLLTGTVLENMPDNVVINGSGFIAHNSYLAVDEADIPTGSIICPGYCGTCNLCKINRGITIYTKRR